jgi:succinate-acetate transporter protein
MESNQGKRRTALGGFLVGGAIFLVAAFVPLFRGERFNTTFLVLGIVFVVLGINASRKSRKDTDQPPAA